MKLKIFLLLLILEIFNSLIFEPNNRNFKNIEKSSKSYSNKNFIINKFNDNEENEDGKSNFLHKSAQLISEIINKLTNQNCIDYLNYILSEYYRCFNNTNNTNNTQSFQDDCRDTIFQHLVIIEDILQSSSLKKNELSYFEGCLYNSNYSYFVIVVDTTNSTKKNETKKKFLNYEESFYLYGFCLPSKNIYYNKSSENEKNKTLTELYCNRTDYEIIITEANNNLSYFLFPENSNIEILSTNLENKLKPLSIIVIIIILIFFFSLLLNNIIFLFLKKILIKTNNNNQEKPEEKKTDNLNINNNDIISKKLKKLHNCFSYQKNLEELINIKTNSTEINNYSGITEIRGLNAISIFFTLLGIVFLAILNSPLKMAGLATMRNLLMNLFYSLIIIGLRYSPRIIFSCSGYTLAYKYLSFIEKNSENFSFFKFFFYQSHKYFLLFFFILFFRYSLNYLIIISKKDILPNWVFFQNKIVEYKKYDSDFWLTFFGINLFFEDQTKRADQKLINYFWIPFNEIYFFIFGVILITIGYKCKLKIDIFIIFLILLGFIGKIIFSYLYRDEFYSTLYYYLFDYGKFMLNPLFNLTYFLIGLYFGLINFVLQKGITNQFDTSLYKKINSLTFEKNEDEIDEEEGENEELIINNNENNNSLERGKNIKKEENHTDDEQNYIKKRNKSTIGIKNVNNNDRKEDTIGYINTEADDLSKKLGQEMPFLIYIIKYINYRKNNSIFKIQYISFLFLLFPIILHYGILLNYHGESKIEDKKNKIKDSSDLDDIDEFFHIINLEKYISNKFLNFIFRIDIELLVIIIHWGIFILQIQGKKTILSIFRYILWGYVSKTYFSFSIISTIVILFIIYSNESIITINIYIILLYFLLILVIVFFLQCFFYIFFEIPLKRMIKYFYNRDNEEYKEDENENENENINENVKVHAINRISQSDESLDMDFSNEKKEDDNENNIFI